MEKVENGVFVSVDYKGTLQDGKLFDSSEGRAPLEVEFGAGNVIKGFEAALEGMSLNEKKTFTLAPNDAYGERNDDSIHTFPRTEMPSDMNPKIGEVIAIVTPDGKQVPAQINKIDDQNVTVDMNHPLAGETLTFEIEVVGISKTATQAAQGCGCGCSCGEPETPDSSGCCK